MNLQEHLPFFNVDNDKYLLHIISSHNGAISDTINSTHTPCLELFADDNFLTPSNWSPSNCKYLTTDDLFCQSSNLNQFTITQVNSRSLKKNFKSFKLYIFAFKQLPEIITVSETWLNEKDHILYNIPSYNFISNPRIHKTGGGVGLYITKHLSYNIRYDLMVSLKDVCEYIVADIALEKNEPITVVSLYRPPNLD